MKIRIERELLSRARACADDVGASLSDWSGRALRLYRREHFAGVATAETRGVATRAGSVVCSLPGDAGEADEMRAALAACVAYCEARRPPPFVTELVAGRDYIIAKEPG